MEKKKSQRRSRMERQDRPWKTGVLWDFFDLTGARVKKTVDGMALIIGLIDSNGKRVVSYQYDRWGKTVSISGTLAATVGKKKPFRYRGYYFDAESGMYYLQSRYYDPEIRRFISVDNAIAGVGGTVNGYNL